jgi:L-ascorbate metabolism protein UlaG (beta-lactamase superfamily)
MKFTINFLLIALLTITAARAQAYEQDVIATNSGPLTITFIKHASLLFNFHKKNIYVDPVAKMGNYDKLPAADIILVTHEHSDHFDPGLIKKLRRADTTVVLTKTCAVQGVEGLIMSNGNEQIIQGIKVKAVPAYNLVHKRPNGDFYHPKGVGNGYVIDFGGKRVYVAGDTENTHELKSQENIEIAFLPMQMPYTMTPEMVADAALCMRPKILYPYHLGETDPNELLSLLKGQKIDVRIRKMP